MMAKGDVPYDVLKDLLEAHTSPLREDLQEIKGMLTQTAAESARANNRIDRHESRFFGWLLGAAGVGGAGGYSISHIIKKMPWS